MNYKTDYKIGVLSIMSDFKIALFCLDITKEENFVLNILEACYDSRRQRSGEANE